MATTPTGPAVCIERAAILVSVPSTGTHLEGTRRQLRAASAVALKVVQRRLVAASKTTGTVGVVLPTGRALARSEDAGDGPRRRLIALGLVLGAMAFLGTRALPGHTSFDDVASLVSAALLLIFAVLQFFPRVANAVDIAIALQLVAYVSARSAHLLLKSHDPSQFSLEAAVFLPWGPVIVTAAWVFFGRSPRLYAFVAGYYAAVLIPGIWVFLFRAALAPSPALMVGVNFILASLAVTIMLRLLLDLEARHAASEAARRVLRDMARTDVVTGLPNRRALEEDLDRETRRAERTGRSPSLILFDVDAFKSINDKKGHDAGDRVMSAVGSVVRRSVRTADIVGRWGGDEFLAILPDTQLDEAVGLAERIRTILATEVVQYAGVPVTGSFGVTRHRRGESVGEAIARADQVLYTAKSRGRNRTEVADQ